MSWLGKVGTGFTYFPFYLQPGRLNKIVANRMLLEPRCTCSISSSRDPPCYWQSQPDFDQKLFFRRFSSYDFKWDQALPSHVYGKSNQFWNRIFGLQQYSVSDFFIYGHLHLFSFCSMASFEVQLQVLKYLGTFRATSGASRWSTRRPRNSCLTVKILR